MNRTEFMQPAARSGNLERRKPDSVVSGEKVHQSYRGFDGSAWPEQVPANIPLIDGLAAMSDWPAVRDHYGERLNNPQLCDAIALTPGSASTPSLTVGGWRFLGYDLGFFESEYSHFSVLLHEVAFGKNPELRGAFRQLNMYLLSSLAVCEEIMAVREGLVRLGRDLETGEIQPIAIWAPPAAFQ